MNMPRFPENCANYAKTVGEMAQKFRVTFNATTKQPERLHVGDEDIAVLTTLLGEFAETNDRNKFCEQEATLLRDAFKLLRNFCADGPETQRKLAQNDLLTAHTSMLYDKFDNEPLPNAECFKTLLQFLTNLAVGNDANATLLRQRYYKRVVATLRRFLETPPKSGFLLLDSLEAFLYNLLLKTTTDEPMDRELIALIFDVYCREASSEYAAFLMELCLNADTYSKLDTEQRLQILRIIRERLLQNEQLEVEQDLLSLFVHDFKRKSDCILKTVDSYLANVEPLEVATLLDLLATLSAKKSDTLMVADKSLLINCCFLLKSIHELGRQDDNDNNFFKPISKLGDENEELNGHPAFGFKASLVQLLGNLCWRNRANQDQLRELDCVPLLLDCCNMDARNPFIIQWVVLALRNLCEGNLENQAVIANMTRQGQVKASTLAEIGVTLSDGQNSVKIVPMDAIGREEKH